MFQKFWGVIFFLAFSPAAWAYDFEADGIYYNILSSDDKTVAVTYEYLSVYTDPSYWGDVTIPETVTNEGTEYRVTTIGDKAFYEFIGLKSVTIPNSVTTIGDKAFYECMGLKSVTIPNSVTTIGSSAFERCYSLALVTIGNNVTTIGGSAFCDCSSLTSVTIGNNVTTIGINAFAHCENLTSVTIPESVTSIGGNAFGGTGLTSVTMPNSVTSIGYRAFNNCAGLTSVTIPESVTTIDEKAFYGCTGLKEVWFNADSCISGGFKECSALATVHIGKNVKRIPDEAFYHCSGLTSVTIPNSVTSIGNSAFSGCSGLKEVTIGNSVTTIGSYAFYICTGLKSVTIGERVTTIGAAAFSNCTNLRTIIALSATPPSIVDYHDASTFWNTYNVTVFPAKGSLHTYKNADGWKDFAYPTAEELLKPQFINGTAGQTTYSCTIRYTHDIDYPVSKLYIPTEEKEYLIDTSKTAIPITVIDLEPQTEYKNIEFVIETVYGETISTRLNFTTDTVKFITQPAINISNTSATLTADITCDAVIGAGFEWRRYDDPELVPSTLSETPIVDGKISGTLRNLTPEKYYKYRPFYRTVKGKYYYGAWLAFGTRDVYAYFEPTVSTRSGEVHGNNSTISGYIVEGSDELLSQGFEYWAETSVIRSTASNPERIEGSGSLMSVTLTGLDYNTTYYYRAYATTAKKTTYGNTESFTTGEDPNLSGIEETEAAAEEGFEVRLSGNPVRNGEIGVQVVGADGATWYRVISLHGAQIAQGVLSDTDEWQQVKIPAASTGYYLLQIIGSKGTKTLRIVVE